MEYTDLKAGQTVQVFIPVMNAFYSFKVLDYGGEGFLLDSVKKIDGHEYWRNISSQEQVDAFFYIHKGQITDEAFEKAEEHYKRNGLGWIFN